MDIVIFMRGIVMTGSSDLAWRRPVGVVVSQPSWRDSALKWRSAEGTLHENCAVIFKVTDEFGGLSNMAGGWPLRVNGIIVNSSEALYQACRFPHQPAWQAEIIAQTSPMAAKMKAKKDGRRATHSRADWDHVNIEVMRWVLHVKLARHYGRMAALLRSTTGRAIVESSRKDHVWGAVDTQDGTLEGGNLLGALLMELREQVETAGREELLTLRPPHVRDFLLLGEPIGVISHAD